MEFDFCLLQCQLREVFGVREGSLCIWNRSANWNLRARLL
jgi:hypothetical protein